jgi:hypothetical protein
MYRIIHPNNLLEQMVITYDPDQQQYSIYNDATPWVYGIGETKPDAIQEYVSALQDFLLISYSKQATYAI